MFEPDGTETLVRFLNKQDREHMRAGVHTVAMDHETLAYYMNDPDIEVLEELTVFSRLSIVDYPDIHQVPEELR